MVSQDVPRNILMRHFERMFGPSHTWSSEQRLKVEKAIQKALEPTGQLEYIPTHENLLALL